MKARPDPESLVRGVAFNRQVVCATGEIEDIDPRVHCGRVLSAVCGLWRNHQNTSKGEQDSGGQSDVNIAHVSLHVTMARTFQIRAIEAPDNRATPWMEFAVQPARPRFGLGCAL